MAKRAFANVIKLRILSWGDYPDELDIITRVLIKWKRETGGSDQDM